MLTRIFLSLIPVLLLTPFTGFAGPPDFPCLADKDFTIEISYTAKGFCGGAGETQWYSIMESGYNSPGDHYGDESVSFKLEYFMGYMFFCRDTGGEYHNYRIHCLPPTMPDNKVFRVERKGNKLLMSLDGKLRAVHPIDFEIRCNKTYPLKIGTITTNGHADTTDMEVKYVKIEVDE